MPDNRSENKAFVGAIPFGGEYHGSRFEDKFQSANQMDGIVILAEVKWLTVGTNFICCLTREANLGQNSELLILHFCARTKMSTQPAKHENCLKIIDFS